MGPNPIIMFPDQDDISSTGNTQQFPPPWLKQNPRVTMKMPQSPAWSKGFLIPGEHHPDTYSQLNNYNTHMLKVTYSEDTDPSSLSHPLHHSQITFSLHMTPNKILPHQIYHVLHLPSGL